MGRVFASAVAVLALLAALASGCGGKGGGWKAAATAAAGATAAPSLSITAKELKFDKQALVMPPDQSVSIEFRNEDAGVLHNVSIYEDESARKAIFRQELFEGVKTVTYRFTTPPPGLYYFRCDAHPDMEGAFIVR